MKRLSVILSMFWVIFLNNLNFWMIINALHTPNVGTKRVEFSSQTRFEESGSSKFLASVQSANADWQKLFQMGILPPGNTYGLPTILQVLCVIQKKIQFFLFGAKSLIEKTDVQAITVESDKCLQDAGSSQGSCSSCQGFWVKPAWILPLKSCCLLTAQSIHNKL